ncbi:MAG: hypothetical protein JXR91_01280 [Deltaproteobacteria bacterium]|nr:hypothetical protein [Deltaproteobacteria bacterium]
MIQTHNQNKYFKAAKVFLLLSIMLPLSAKAQISGQRINPNVIFMIDTGTGMNWLKPVDPNTTLTSGERTELSVKACDNMNLPNPLYTHEKTSWQTLLEATLGSSTQVEYQHCFYEEPTIRPYIHDDTITGLTETGTALYQKMHDYTDEYWKNNREPHMRIVNCFDPRESGNRGDWNEQYQQCIGADISSIPGHIIHEGLKDYWCQDIVDGKPNYVTTTDGDEICFNYHPKALPRTTDGILERYRSLARFSVMTFDNLPGPTEVDAATWDLDTQHRAGWDFGPNREWYMSAYEQRDGSTGTRAWNAGIRGDYSSAVGRLVKISNDIEHSNSEVRKVLDTVEPLHCSFDAAFFDDMGEYVYNASEIRPAYSNGSDLYFNCRPKLVIFITDGVQTDAVEFPQNYCAKDNKQPPPPWPGPYTPPTAATGPYTCPFNSTSMEAQEAFHVVDKIASSAGASISSVDPMYLVVIGINMKDKEAGPGNRCDGDPTWITSPKGDYCKPPGDDCVSIDEVPQTECVGTSAVYKAAYLTPRQYLNTLALSGWPDPTMPGGSIAPFIDTSTGGTFIDPPWRGTTPAVDWCATKPNMCGGEDGDGMPDGALFVDNRDDLSAVLDTILNGFKYDDTATRTELATTNVVNDFSSMDGTFFSTMDNVKQYVFNSGYRSVAGEPWQGVLNRQGYKCTQTGDTTGGAVASAFKDFQTALKTQGGDNRKIYVVDKEFDEEAIVYDSDPKYKKGLGGILTLIDASNYDDCHFGLPTPFCSGNSIYFNKVIDYLKGVPGIGKRAEYPLGDIYNSSPFILSPPRERVPFDSYQTFRTIKYKDYNGAEIQNYDRQPYLYVGTNDGILHSFNVWAKVPSNIEGWGFVPTPLVENLDLQFPIKWKNSYTQTNPSDPLSWVVDGYDIFTEDDDEAGSYQHTFGVDAPPIAGDVLLYKDGSDKESEWWRSVVIGGLGKGGYGYYCLDVTAEPESKPTYRWQLSHTNFGGNVAFVDTTSWDQADIDALNAKKGVTKAQFQEMGLGLSKPELAYVYYNAVPPVPGVNSPIDHQAAVAILPGGYLNDESHGIETSTGVYIVRVVDGRLERYLKPDVDTDLCDPDSLMFESNLYPVPSTGAKPLAKVAQLVGQPIVPNGIRTGKVADEAFIGDDRGRVWRIDMSSKDPADWCLEVFFDTMLAEHFPYKDCLNSTASTPGTSKCCDEKDSSVGNSCSQSDIDAFMTDANIGIDDCTGAACTTPNFPFPRIMMLAPPTIVQDEDRNNILLFGTGEIDGLATINHNRVFSVTVTPTITVGADTASVSRSLPTINWWLGEDISDYPVGKHTNTSDGLGYIEAQMYPSSGNTLAPSIVSTYFDYWGIGEKMLGRISVFDKTAYFVTFTPLEKSTAADYLDACNGGGSKIWGVNFNDLADFPKLPDESGLGGPDVSYYERDNQLLTGLRLVRRPGCEGTEGFVLMVQKAQPPAGQSANPGTSDNAAPITSETISISGGNRGFTRVGIDSWSIVLGGQ